MGSSERRRCGSRDGWQTGLEPRKLFNVVEFMMHDKDCSGTIDMDECMEILFRRFGKEQLEARVNEFMDHDEVRRARRRCVATRPPAWDCFSRTRLRSTVNPLTPCQTGDILEEPRPGRDESSKNALQPPRPLQC